MDPQAPNYDRPPKRKYRPEELKRRLLGTGALKRAQFNEEGKQIGIFNALHEHGDPIAKLIAIKERLQGPRHDPGLDIGNAGINRAGNKSAAYHPEAIVRAVAKPRFGGPSGGRPVVQGQGYQPARAQVQTKLKRRKPKRVYYQG